MNARMMVCGALALSMLCAAGERQTSQANQVLVGNPFVVDTQGWVDPIPAAIGDWRVNLHAATPTIMETNDAAPGTGTATGNYSPTILIQNNFVTPSTYDYNVRMYTNDDDLWGIVFGYQDPSNYYRVGFRAQGATATPPQGNLGGTSGVSVQKVVGGIVTQITPAGAGNAYMAFPTLGTGNTRAPVDIKLSVDGNNYSVFVAGENGGNALITGSDSGLAAGKIGVQSWAQHFVATSIEPWGTEVESVSVTQGANTLYQQSNFDWSPYQWRELDMANESNRRASDTTTGIDLGNFGVMLNGPYIQQRGNGFQYATSAVGGVAANGGIDFIGPAVVIDEPGAASYKNYEFKIRLAARDNDGFGVIVRAQDDDNFYRINFTNEGNGTNINQIRAPRGVSVQKVRDGDWSELYRDNGALFVHTVPGETSGQTPTTGLENHWFDLSVKAVDNTLQIQIINNAGAIIDLPLITDANDPILRGSVGLTTWGNVFSYYMGYGGGNGPLLVRIPEPSTIALALLAGLGLFGLARRRK